MKKIILVALAAVGLAACATEDTIVTPKGNAIAFGDAFVDNATKAIYESNNTLKEFQVWGNVVATGSENTPVALYGNTGAKVYGSEYNKLWNCDVVRYWTPSCTFKFVAIAHATSVGGLEDGNGVPTTISYTADGSSDLLLDTITATTNESSVPQSGVKTIEDGTTNVVAFTMEHLLSRVAIKFTGASELHEDYSYNVKDIKIADAYAQGTYTIGTGWTSTSGDMTDLAFAEVSGVKANTSVASTNAYVIIPGAAPLTITFNAVVVFKGTEISKIPYTITLNKTADDTEKTLVAGHSYTFAVTLPKPGMPIQFAVETVSGFTSEGGDVTIQ